MKSSNFSSYNKTISKVNGNFITATSLNRNAIAIAHKSIYNCLWKNFEEHVISIIRITLANDSTIEIPFTTKFIAYFYGLGIPDGIGLLYETNNIILPIQHKNIEIIQNPTYPGGSVPTDLCEIFNNFFNGSPTTTEYSALGYDVQGGNVIVCFNGQVSQQDPEDCDSNGVIDIQGDLYGYFVEFQSGATCP